MQKAEVGNGYVSGVKLNAEGMECSMHVSAVTCREQWEELGM